MTIFDYLCPGLVDTSYPRKGNLFLVMGLRRKEVFEVVKN
jgi:hypothetical protein